jgi:hypothetical protein
MKIHSDNGILYNWRQSLKCKQQQNLKTVHETVCTCVCDSSTITMLQSEFVQREALMSRANSLKKAIRQLVEHAEQAVDEQNKTRAGPSFLVTPPAPQQQQQHQRRASRTLDIPGLSRPTSTLKVSCGKLVL